MARNEQRICFVIFRVILLFISSAISALLAKIQASRNELPQRIEGNCGVPRTESHGV
jgi:hypothetical protein